jgi:hypothetical protein
VPGGRSHIRILGLATFFVYSTWAALRELIIGLSKMAQIIFRRFIRRNLALADAILDRSPVGTMAVFHPLFGPLGPGWFSAPCYYYRGA